MSRLPRAYIHLNNIAENWRTLDRLHPGASTAAVVKADAYGLGAPRVARALAGAGCDTFFVAYTEEAIAVRRALGPALGRIFVLNGPAASELRTYKDARLTAVLSSPDHVELWRQARDLPCALHFDTWVPNFGIQEYMRHTEETDAVFPHDYHFEKGELFIGETPGHGVDIDEKLAARYPYKPAYLPVARLEDGTMWSW